MACSCRSDLLSASCTCSPVAGTSRRIVLADLDPAPELQSGACQISCQRAGIIDAAGTCSVASAASTWGSSYPLGHLGLCCCVVSLIRRKVSNYTTDVYLNFLDRMMIYYYSSSVIAFGGDHLRLIPIHLQNRRRGQLLLLS